MDRIETDGGDEGRDSAAVAMTDAHPPSLQHELQLSFKDFIVGYPTQTGSLLATLRLCVSIFHHILWHAPLGAPNVDISLQSGRF